MIIITTKLHQLALLLNKIQEWMLTRGHDCIVHNSVSSREVGTGDLAFLNFPFPGKFVSESRKFYFSKDIKWYLKLFFKIRKFFEDKMFVRLKFFPHFLEKIEKFKLSLSKQHYKMLNMRSEMQINQKKSVKIKLRKFSREFPESRGFSGS